MNTLQNQLIQIIKISIVAAALLLAVTFASAWTGPTAVPPNCPAGGVGCDAPVHTGVNLQTKSGALWANFFGTTGSGYFGGKLGIGTQAPGPKVEIVGSGNDVVDLKVNGRVHLGDTNNKAGIWFGTSGVAATPGFSLIGQNPNRVSGKNVAIWQDGWNWNFYRANSDTWLWYTGVGGSKDSAGSDRVVETIYQNTGNNKLWSMAVWGQTQTGQVNGLTFSHFNNSKGNFDTDDSTMWKETLRLMPDGKAYSNDFCVFGGKCLSTVSNWGTGGTCGITEQQLATLGCPAGSYVSHVYFTCGEGECAGGLNSASCRYFDPAVLTRSSCY